MGILRLLLALSVIAHHANSPVLFTFLTRGRLSVEAFFIISGFYMSLILNEKYKQVGSYKLFITNRFLRIYPIYWVITMSVVVLSLLGHFFAKSGSWLALDLLGTYAATLGLKEWAYLLFSNLFIFFHEAVSWMGFDVSTGTFFYIPFWWSVPAPHVYNFMVLPAAWSISVELQFYLVAPLILRSSKKVIILAFLSLCVRAIFCYVGYCQDPWTYNFFPSELIFFLLGYGSYALYRYILRQKTSDIWGWIGLTLVVFLALIQEYNRLYYKSELFIVTVAFAIPFIFKTTKALPWDKRVGELSYPVYLVHVFIIFLLTKAGMPIRESLGTIAALTSIVVSIVLLKLISDPIEKIRQRRLKESLTTAGPIDPHL